MASVLGTSVGCAGQGELMRGIVWDAERCADGQFASSNGRRISVALAPAREGGARPNLNVWPRQRRCLGGLRSRVVWAAAGLDTWPTLALGYLVDLGLCCCSFVVPFGPLWTERVVGRHVFCSFDPFLLFSHRQHSRNSTRLPMRAQRYLVRFMVGGGVVFGLRRLLKSEPRAWRSYLRRI